MATGKCLKCDKIAEMTEDHVLPKWFRKALPNFKLKIPPTAEIQLLCSGCNNKKAGVIDYENPTTRNFMKEIATQLIGEIRKHEEFNP